MNVGPTMPAAATAVTAIASVSPASRKHCDPPTNSPSRNVLGPVKISVRAPVGSFQTAYARLTTHIPHSRADAAFSAIRGNADSCYNAGRSTRAVHGLPAPDRVEFQACAADGSLAKLFRLQRPCQLSRPSGFAVRRTTHVESRGTAPFARSHFCRQ